MATRPIPARAGQPSASTKSAWPRRAYPRSRGATVDSDDLEEPFLGLSPLARGNLVVVLGGIAGHGPIPARAGQPTN